jgi:hypothetical protein
MTTSSSPVRTGRGVTVIVGLVLLGAGVTACGGSNTAASPPSTAPSGPSPTTTAAAPSGSSSARTIEALASSVQGAGMATFKAVYTVSSAGTTETATVEQAPPKSAFSTKGEAVIATGTGTYLCTDAGQAVCYSAGTTNPLTSLAQLFNPQTALNEVKAAAGVIGASGSTITFSPGSYGGQSTTCANVIGKDTNEKFCWTKQGVLAYADVAGSTLSLTSYSTSPPASDFDLPAGATVDTIPLGLNS